MAISPNGRFLATCGQAPADHYVRLVTMWDTHHQRKLAVLDTHRHDVESLTFSPDGHTLVTTSRDGKVRLWSVSTGQPLTELSGHYGQVLCADFSADGRLLVSGGTVSDNNNLPGDICVRRGLTPAAYQRSLTDYSKSLRLHEVGDQIEQALWTLLNESPPEADSDSPPAVLADVLELLQQEIAQAESNLEVSVVNELVARLEAKLRGGGHGTLADYVAENKRTLVEVAFRSHPEAAMYRHAWGNELARRAQASAAIPEKIELLTEALTHQTLLETFGSRNRWAGEADIIASSDALWPLHAHQAQYRQAAGVVLALAARVARQRHDFWRTTLLFGDRLITLSEQIDQDDRLDSAERTALQHHIRQQALRLVRASLWQRPTDRHANERDYESRGPLALLPAGQEFDALTQAWPAWTARERAAGHLAVEQLEQAANQLEQAFALRPLSQAAWDDEFHPRAVLLAGLILHQQDDTPAALAEWRAGYRLAQAVGARGEDVLLLGGLAGELDEPAHQRLVAHTQRRLAAWVDTTDPTDILACEPIEQHLLGQCLAILAVRPMPEQLLED